MPVRSSTVARLAGSTLVVNLFVILWGAWVRASGSGAGCGNHWPTCNGTIIPVSPTMHTVVEFTHRASTGAALIMVVLMVLAARRVFPAGHRVRWSAMTALFLLFVEAAIGAGLVKFELVASNATLVRGVSLGVHLVNTQLLLTAIALTGWWARDPAPVTRQSFREWRGRFGAAFLALIAVGMSGAIASLGDTLFPSRSLAAGWAQDHGPTVNVLLHIRVWHPVLAVLTGAGLLWLASAATARASGVQRAGRRLTVAVLGQWSVGLLSLVLLVPVALQLLHLLAAEVVWLAVVSLGVAVADAQPARITEETSRAASASNSVPAPSSR